MKDNLETKKVWWQPALTLFFKMSAWIGFPVILAIFIGKRFDEKFETSPFGFLGFIGFSFIFSMIMIVKIANMEYKKIELEEKNKKK